MEIKMAKIEPFEKYTQRYEEWFEKHKFAYLSELKAVKEILPKFEKGLEVGVGTGRFAVPLGIQYGVEPSKKMAEIAEKRGVKVINGVAENLPFEDESFDLVLIVTTICFVDDILKTLKEAYRVLKPNGYLVIGFIDKNSPLGEYYQKIKEKNPFYREAKFISTDELLNYLKKAGFGDFKIVQTIFHKLDEIKNIEPVKEGFGEGSFVVIRAKKIKK
jgi:ubiquinone/menaquinone biosynthesis C-methylase UbiE